METQMQFQKNARVVVADGQQVGSIDRVVLNPETKVVTHIVVHKDTLLKREEKVIPIGLVEETSADQIVLREEAGDLASLPPFEERHLVDTEAGVKRPHPSINSQPSVAGYPGISVSIGPEPDKFNTLIEQNIPSGTVALKAGAKVITVDGKHIGQVERVLAEPPYDHATHLLVSSGMFTKEAKLIPISWVQMIFENEVHLRIKGNSLKGLADVSIDG